MEEFLFESFDGQLQFPHSREKTHFHKNFYLPAVSLLQFPHSREKTIFPVKDTLTGERLQFPHSREKTRYQ